MHYGKGSIFTFQDIFATTDEFYFVFCGGGGVGGGGEGGELINTRQLLYEVLRFSRYFLIF